MSNFCSKYTQIDFCSLKNRAYKPNLSKKIENLTDNRGQSPQNLNKCPPYNTRIQTTPIKKLKSNRVSKSDDYFFFSFQSITAVTERKQ